MTSPDSNDLAAHEAADWCARLNSRTISTSELEAFYRWRRVAENAVAYEQTERAWRHARPLGGDPDIGKALSEVLERPTAQRGRWQGWRIGLGFAGSAVLAAIFAFWLISRPVVFETGIGEQRLVRLDDGTRVRLDTQSRVEVGFEQHERSVRLAAGQAFFEVIKDATRPFVVRTDGASVRALGTRFGVRTDADETSVVLAEGAVRVTDPNAASVVLAPGEQVVTVNGRLTASRPADLTTLTSWTMGRLVFDDTPLPTAVAEMNRYTVRPITLRSRRAATVRVSGVFDTGASETFVTAASAIAGLQITHLPDGGLQLTD